MPIIKSAKKRVKTAHKAAVRNSHTKRSLRSALKVFGKSPSSKNLAATQSQLDKAAKKGVIHKNKASRLKRQAAAKAKSSGSSANPAKKTATKSSKTSGAKKAAKK